LPITVTSVVIETLTRKDVILYTYWQFPLYKPPWTVG